ncbi:MAG: hypothetical protein KGL56_13285 [Alphaproteobacteria bacterium]|nr:hypothetical protein [Alphaproteobacteria bacterium]
MKRFLFFVPLAALVMTPVAVLAYPNAPSIQGGIQAMGLDTIPRTDLSNLRQVVDRQHKLYELRQEGLKLQAEDGGTLTPQHRAYLQAKLDAIQAHSTE